VSTRLLLELRAGKSSPQYQEALQRQSAIPRNARGAYVLLLPEDDKSAPFRE
jgi:hypothetical protein